MFAEHLYNKQQYQAAALCRSSVAFRHSSLTSPDSAFVLAGRPARAMAAYEQAQQWRELFTLAISEKVPVEELEDMCTRVAGVCAA